jgi:hypothetical protein
LLCDFQAIAEWSMLFPQSRSDFRKMDQVLLQRGGRCAREEAIGR